jgi:Periplasmic component of the Tol biopolymer transport system
MKMQATIILFVIMLSSCSAVSTSESIETPIPTLTIIPVPTSTAFPTPTAYPTTERFEFSMLSPDGTKQIQSKDWVTFDIVDIRSSEVLRSFSYDRAKFGEGAGYSPEAGYVPFYWSQNGEYIYVYAHQGLDGGVKYFGDAFGAEEGVARFNMNTGMMEEIVPEREGGGYTFSISADEKGIIYVDQRETPLILRWKDLSSGKEKELLTFSETILDVGDFGWSPQGNKLIFQTMGPNGNDFLLLDLESLKTEIIIQEFKEPVNLKFWKDANKVFYSNWKEVVWQLDLDLKSLTMVGTATPSP